MASSSNILSEVRSVTLSVSSIDDALRLYRDILGFEVVARGEVAPELYSAWRLPSDGRWEVAQLAQGGDPGGEESRERTGAIRLIAPRREGTEARPVDGRLGDWIWDAGADLAGDGYYAVNLRVRDLHALLPRLRAHGLEVPGEPYFWEVSEEVAVWDSMSRDADGVFLDLFAYERGGDLRGPLVRDVSVVQTVAIATHDVERCRDFYGALGFEVLFDLHLEGLEELLHVPEGVSIRNINMMKNGSVVPGRVECFSYRGRDLPPPYPLRDRAAPPNRGIAAVTLETGDRREAEERLVGAGALPIAPWVETTLPGWGDVLLATYFGPDGECLEIVESYATR